MNYRHAFHAGNFADVVKHATLVRILVHLCAKPAPFRVIDTHAGAGLYDLAGSQASRSGEWHDGIARLLAAPTPPLLAPYLEVVARFNGADAMTVYPGSPMLVRAFLRSGDRLIACEFEPSAATALAGNLKGDRRCKAIAIDGWTALNAYVPPRERRGLVLIDPPFEGADDFPRLGNALEGAHRKWPNGIYLLWYPLKERQVSEALARRLRRSGIGKMLRVELSLATPRNSDRMRACGLIVVNPPWKLEGELPLLMPELAAALGGAHRLDWLVR